MIFQTDDGAFVSADTLIDEAQLLQAIEASSRSLHLHLHGGLIDDERGIEIANNLMANGPDDTPAGYGPLDGVQSLYWVWQTGAFEVLAEKIERNKFIRVVRSIATRLTGNQVLEGSAGARSGAYANSGILNKRDVSGSHNAIRRSEADPLEARLLRSDYGPELIEEDYQSVLENDAEITELANALVQEIDGGDATGAAEFDAASWEQFKVESAAIKAEAADAKRGIMSGLAASWASRKVAKIVFASVNRYRKGRHHGLTCTVAEEAIREFFLVKTIWSEIKERSRAQFSSRNGAGQKIASAIAAKAASDPSWTLVITAHSAGAILAVNLLDALSDRGPQHPFCNLILIAPAATAQRAKESGEALERVVKSIQLVNLSDEAERGDQVKRLLYPRSILYLVSGALEGGSDVPLVGMERFFNEEILPDRLLNSEANNHVDWMRDRFSPTAFITGDTFPGGHKHIGKIHGIDSDPSVLKALGAWIRSTVV